MMNDKQFDNMILGVKVIAVVSITILLGMVFYHGFTAGGFSSSNY